jgi:hypothetical protein
VRAHLSQPIEEFLAAHRIAVVGVSRRTGFGNAAFRTLRDKGWDVVPVNEGADELEGTRCFRALEEVAPPPQAVLVVTPPARTPAILESCARLGIRRVWLQQGSESEEAIRLAADRGLALVSRACILMYARPTGLHRFHGWLTRLGEAR